MMQRVSRQKKGSRLCGGSGQFWAVLVISGHAHTMSLLHRHIFTSTDSLDPHRKAEGKDC